MIYLMFGSIYNHALHTHVFAFLGRIVLAKDGRVFYLCESVRLYKLDRLLFCAVKTEAWVSSFPSCAKGGLVWAAPGKDYHPPSEPGSKHVLYVVPYVPHQRAWSAILPVIGEYYMYQLYPIISYQLINANEWYPSHDGWRLSGAQFFRFAAGTVTLGLWFYPTANANWKINENHHLQ